MMRLSRPLPRRQRESTIALINVVFLMLIFFLIAGTLAPPMDRGIDLISTATAENAAPPDALFVTREGELRANGETVEAESYMAALKAEGMGEEALQVKVAADRELPATRLIEIVGTLRAAGAARVSIVTERTAE
jgi:biopolymer transport protein ExbD